MLFYSINGSFYRANHNIIFGGILNSPAVLFICATQHGSTLRKGLPEIKFVVSGQVFDGAIYAHVNLMDEPILIN